MILACTVPQINLQVWFVVFSSQDISLHTHVQPACRIYLTSLVRASHYQLRILLFDLLKAVVITKCLEVMKVPMRQSIHTLTQM